MTTHLKIAVTTAAVLMTVPCAAEAQRRPLSVEQTVELKHAPTGTRLRYDAQREAFERYPLNGRIEAIPEKGTFMLSWVGVDGSRKEIEWEPPNRVVAVVEGSVDFDERRGVYTYSYTFRNLPTSPQPLRTIYVEGINITRGGAQSAGWYSRDLTSFLKDELGISDGWAWSYTAERSGIPAGGSRAGFTIESPLPPGIVSVFAAGHTEVLNPDEIPPDELHAAIDGAWFNLPSGYTIGPVSIEPLPNREAAARWTLDMIDDADRLGWFGSADATVIGELRQEVQAILTQADGHAAVTQLRQVVQQASLSGAWLDESVALLHYRLPLIGRQLR